MIKKILFLLLVFFSPTANSNKDLSEELSYFQSLIGKTYEGEFAATPQGSSMADVQYWERILNGNGIRITHSINDGEYGGEIVIMWDWEKEVLTGWYFTTAGFYTQQKYHIEDDALVSYEDVVGNENGITAVRSSTKIIDNGFHRKTEYFLEEEWVYGHELFYEEVLDKEVIFK